MHRVASFLRLLLLAALVSVFGLTTPVQARETRYPGVALADLPVEAQHVLRLIEQGGPFPYPHKDGSVFGNFEKRLPLQRRGYYREYTVPTPGSRNRGARRIVAGQGSGGDVASSGEYYYTGDHYRSFHLIHE